MENFSNYDFLRGLLIGITGIELLVTLRGTYFYFFRTPQLEFFMTLGVILQFAAAVFVLFALLRNPVFCLRAVLIISTVTAALCVLVPTLMYLHSLNTAPTPKPEWNWAWVNQYTIYNLAAAALSWRLFKMSNLTVSAAARA
ncbi:MAG: hypothetical protein LBD30_02465 [Verrucomicrobiales bacterium]|jgi:hypothetical protein|nr:hypothetical protein [Verrucomicrobiales bacterium]